MSYEGYTEYLCVDGHYWAVDCFMDYSDVKPSCPSCKKGVAFGNSVDQTNASDAGKAVLEEIAPAKTCACKCGNVHVIEPARFKVMRYEDGKPIREWPDETEPIGGEGLLDV